MKKGKKELEQLLQLKTEELELHKREQEIALALERVREKALAMRSSKDISDATAIVFIELSKLGIEMDRCGIATYNDTPEMEVWSTLLSAKDNEVIKVTNGKLDYRFNSLLIEIRQNWKEKKDYYSRTYSGDEVKKYYSQLEKAPDYHFPKVAKYPEKHVANMFYFEQGFIFIWTEYDLTGEVKDILKRFTKEFSLTYTRYLDIKKAEAQAREAQIEASLERVRAKAMAMHSSKDISGAVAVVFNELTRLGIELERCGIGIFNNPPILEIWSTPLSQESKQVVKVITGKINTDIHPMLQKSYRAWKDKKDFFSYELKGAQVKKYYKLLEKEPGYNFPRVTNYSERQILNSFNFNEGGIFVYSRDKLSDETKQIIHRFSKVFSLTYKRYVDLINAEVRARESQIEASLERVRAKAMAMRSSKDISGATAVVFNELTRLGIELERCGIAIFNDSPIIEIWSTPLSQEDKQVVKVITGKINSNIHPMLQKSYQAWNDKRDFFSFELKGVKVKKYYEILEKEPGYNFPKVSNYSERQILNSFHFNEGGIFVYSRDVLPEEEKNIFRRFAVVFEQTYTRFLDIQKAEAQAKQAIQQASLDRVRGEIASMRSASDLELITPLIFKELTILGVPFIRCGIFIIQEKEELVEAYLSSPDGKSLGILRLPFQASELTFQTVEAWRRGDIYKQHWNKEDFIQWINQLMEQDQIQDSSTYQGSAAPPESLDLHFVPFAQGMLYVGAVSPLDEKELELVQALAKAFSIAYSRYEDFVKLDQAKTELESSMNELKATQTQLIQQEKLASLGQLTAGIAHEIQNPLNFVNNFSEVSAELVDEIQDIRRKTQDGKSEEEEDEILEDIKQNLEKINHHGKRADAIVKGMLEHSKSGSGVKEITDVNTLAKEYLSLAYQSFKSKNKEVEIEMVTEFDSSLPKIELVRPDIGKVLLNILNNAFYACAIKDLPDFVSNDKENLEGLGSIVTISTKNLGDEVEISISDNGPGIPDAIQDKIFQPFFTTKQTGQGTGLGLSLSYDIVKAHGGEIRVESIKGESGSGTIFTITLPV